MRPARSHGAVSAARLFVAGLPAVGLHNTAVDAIKARPPLIARLARFFRRKTAGDVVDHAEADIPTDVWKPSKVVYAAGRERKGGKGPRKPTAKPQAYRKRKRAVMFFLSDEAFSQMHVLLTWQDRKKVQVLTEELMDDLFRRENASRLVR